MGRTGHCCESSSLRLSRKPCLLQVPGARIVLMRRHWGKVAGSFGHMKTAEHA